MTTLGQLATIAFISVNLAKASLDHHGHQPGGYLSLSESMLRRGADALVPRLVHDIKNIVIPGVNQSLFWIDPIRFQDVTIKSYDVSVVEDKGVKVSLEKMSNVIAHTRLGVDLRLIKCTGEIWASATGSSYTAMNTIVTDKDGNGKLQTVTPPGGFDVGAIEVHHKMDGFICEAAADVLHIVDGVVIDLIKNTLQAHLASIIAAIVDKPVDLLLGLIEKPPALGFGKEKFRLDNSYLAVNYDNHRITHLHKSEFKSTLHPQESSLKPPSLSASGDRDIQFAFSDYVVNTLFDALHAEHIGEAQMTLPYIKTIFDKECPKCPIAVQNKFNKAGRQEFLNGEASAKFTQMTLTIGALSKASKVLPMVTLSVNASAGVSFSLKQTATNYGVKASLALNDFEQQLLVSHIGKIDMSDLTRDVKLLLNSLLGMVNKDMPLLPIPTIAGVKLGKPAFTIADRVLLLEADLVMPDSPMTIMESLVPLIVV